MPYSIETKTYKKEVQKRTPQSVTKKVDKKMVKNTQRLYVYKASDMDILRRFLILGTTEPTFHAGRKNVGKNVSLVEKMVRKDGIAVVNLVLDLDAKNVLIRKNQAIFVLAYALAKGDLEVRKHTAENVMDVVRTGRDLALFVEELNNLGGWGRLKRETVSKWYGKPINALGYQVVKYRNSGQYEHRNVLRLSHPKPVSEEHDNLFSYLVGKEYDKKTLPKQVAMFEKIKKQHANGKLTTEKLVKYIQKDNLTHEMIPTQFKNEPAVWTALAENMPFRALVWNLSTFSRLGMLKELSSFEKMIVAKLTDKEAVKGSRIHPFTLLVAARNYAAGRGERSSWPVNYRVVDALEQAFDLSLDAVEDTGLRYGLIVDVSGSMTGGNVSGSKITPIEVAGAMAMVNSRQGDAVALGVNNYVTKVQLSKRSTLLDTVNKFKRLGGWSTNLGLGIEWFIKNRVVVDCFVYYTDNEVNQGRHVVQLLDQYKRKVNKDAKLVCVATEANRISIADTSRNDMLDITGFDPTAVSVIDNFVKEM